MRNILGFEALYSVHCTDTRTNRTFNKHIGQKGHLSMKFKGQWLDFM